jgi:hypothetical protein
MLRETIVAGLDLMERRRFGRRPMRALSTGET